MDYPTWGKGNVVGGVYVLNKEDIESVLGYSGGRRLQTGDKVLCIKHAGDCFYKYNLLRESKEGVLSIVKGAEFGSYALTSELIRVFKKEFVLK